MKLIHRIALRADAAQRRELLALGLKIPEGIALPGGGDPLLSFDVDEADPSWPAVTAILQNRAASDVVRTVFSKREIDAARWLKIEAWHHGFPQPDEDDFGYLRATYDLTEWCEQCGVGKKQKAPFQMKGEPKWGRHGLLQLTWVYDELFVTPKIWSEVFAPHGVRCRPVMSRHSVELETVVQIVVEDVVHIATSGLPSERCERCGRTKYLPVARGAFPALLGDPATPMARTAESFGSGGQADARLLVSQRIARDLAASDGRGASLVPVTAG